MWAYIRRNKAKILASGVIITGGVYTLKKAVDFLNEKQITESSSFNIIRVCLLFI